MSRSPQLSLQSHTQCLCFEQPPVSLERTQNTWPFSAHQLFYYRLSWSFSMPHDSHDHHPPSSRLESCFPRRKTVLSVLASHSTAVTIAVLHPQFEHIYSFNSSHLPESPHASPQQPDPRLLHDIHPTHSRLGSSHLDSCILLRRCRTGTGRLEYIPDTVALCRASRVLGHIARNACGPLVPLQAPSLPKY